LISHPLLSGNVMSPLDISCATRSREDGRYRPVSVAQSRSQTARRADWSCDNSFTQQSTSHGQLSNMTASPCQLDINSSPTRHVSGWLRPASLCHPQLFVCETHHFQVIESPVILSEGSRKGKCSGKRWLEGCAAHLRAPSQLYTPLPVQVSWLNVAQSEPDFLCTKLVVLGLHCVWIRRRAHQSTWVCPNTLTCTPSVFTHLFGGC